MMDNNSLTRSQLIEKLGEKFHLSSPKSEQSVKIILSCIINTLRNGHRVEIRKFGSFEIRTKAARSARNPKTGEVVHMEKQFTAHFKAGQPLRERINITNKN